VGKPEKLEAMADHSVADGERFAPQIPWVLFLIMMVFFAIFPRLVLSPLLLRISDGLGIDYSRASSFFLTASFGFITGLLVSGFISKALTHRWTIVASVAITGTSLLLLSMVKVVLLFHLLIFIGGWANGLYPGSGVASVAALVPSHHRGKALALHESGPNLAFILAPIIAAIVAPMAGWRGVFALTGAAALCAAALFAAFGRGQKEAGEPPHFENIKLFLHNRAFIVISILFAVVVSAAVGVFSILPTFLVVEHGRSEQFVNTLVGISRITGFAAIFTAGALSDRFGFKAVVAVIMAITGGMTILIGVLAGTPLLVAVFFQPLVVQAFFPVAVRALTDVSPPAARNLSIALAIPLANLVGAGVAPRAFGAVAAAGYFEAGFIVLGSITVASLALLPLLGRAVPARARTTP
jgi:NNP family nitrate/nitrite transporter-like MFS transporter